MITAVDTNIILDILIPGAPHGDDSESALSKALRSGALIISEAVYAELAVHFPDIDSLDRFLDDTGIRMQPSGGQALFRAGATWLAYVRRRPANTVYPHCGAVQAALCRQCQASISPRQHLLADFMIGAHAIVHADRLMTRDRGYYQTYFPELVLA